MYFAVSSGEGTEVYHSSHRRPSLAAAVSPSRWLSVSGSNLTPLPSSVTGTGVITEVLELWDQEFSPSRFGFTRPFAIRYQAFRDPVVGLLGSGTRPFPVRPGDLYSVALNTPPLAR